jgi:hypothetical protein
MLLREGEDDPFTFRIVLVRGSEGRFFSLRRAAATRKRTDWPARIHPAQCRFFGEVVFEGVCTLSAAGIRMKRLNIDTWLFSDLAILIACFVFGPHNSQLTKFVACGSI